MLASDLTGALQAFLAADADVSNLAGSRVYAGVLPSFDGEPKAPSKSLVIQPTGGVELFLHTKLQTQRVDVVCYGESHAEADKLRRAAYSALKTMGRTTQGKVLIHNVTPAGGPQISRDRDTEWPIVVQAFQAVAAENEVA